MITILNPHGAACKQWLCAINNAYCVRRYPRTQCGTATENLIMAWFRCMIHYQPASGGKRQVTKKLEAKNSVEAKSRAGSLYANTVSVHVSGIPKPR
ncbi:hypothetical protein NVP2275O_088 [Vibrio phage 2.275.O._10N.286.54.E11]|nr:hypothetical protein NVP2275O_088 [Vibrio phage 2.275.O._10N.286.54.E11]